MVQRLALLLVALALCACSQAAVTPEVRVLTAVPLPTYTPYPTFTPLPTYTPFPTPTPFSVTSLFQAEAIRQYALAPSDLGADYRYWQEGVEVDEGENVKEDFPNRALPESGLQSTLWRRFKLAESDLFIMQIVGIYENADSAQSALIKGSTKLLEGYVTVKELPINFGDSAIGMTGSWPDGKTVGYASLTRYGNLLSYLYLSAHTLPATLPEQIQKAAERKILGVR